MTLVHVICPRGDGKRQEALLDAGFERTGRVTGFSMRLSKDCGSWWSVGEARKLVEGLGLTLQDEAALG